MAMRPAKAAPVFRSRLRRLSILDLERMTAQLHRREFEEQQERQAWLDEQRKRPKPARRP
jgi:hypothetical protein